jgi:UDP-glucose:(heptosyl)LPS alpha-1,3-glucosyltransferase
MLKNEIVHHYGVEAGKTVVIHHGVDTEAFHPRNRSRWREGIRSAYGVRSGESVALFVGGDYRRKGLTTLVKAVRRLPSVKVFAVGVKPDGELHSISKANGLEDRIIFLPGTEHVAQFYAAADFFVLPTSYDTFSLATLEAMASGLPVVVSSGAGVSEILNQNSDCLLLDDPTNVEELGYSLGRLLHETGLKEHLGSEARSTAERHSWERVVEETVRVYEDTADSP